MNNWKNNTKRLPRQLARRKSARGCEPSSLKMTSQLFPLFPYRHSVTDGDTTRTYTYHADGQLATASYSGDGRALSPRAPQKETFLWDGFALVRRNNEHFFNEPHVGNAPKKLRFEGKPRAQRSARRARKGPRGNPVASSKGKSYFNDMLRYTNSRIMWSRGRTLMGGLLQLILPLQYGKLQQVRIYQLCIDIPIDSNTEHVFWQGRLIWERK